MPRIAQRADPQALRRVTLAAILVYLLLIPQQFEFVAFDIRLSAYRMFLLGASLYIMANALRTSLRVTWADMMIVLAIMWIALASYMSSGSIKDAVVQGGSHLVDIALAYFLARTAIQTPTDLRRFLVLIAPGIAATGAIVAIEAIFHRSIIHAAATALTGNPGGPSRLDVRLGFMRGIASFPHPILVGIFLASFLPLYLFSGLRGWPRIIGVVGSVFGVLSMSSAAMLGIVVGGILSAYDWVTERIRNISWRLFMMTVSVLYVVIETTSSTGFYGLIVRYASLNAVSAYNRILIWNFGTENILANPWFGIGYADWDRPSWMHSDSFDWFWLILALRFGILEAVLLLAVTIIAIAGVALRSRFLTPGDARLLRGVAIALAVFALGLNSVSLWMASLAWFFMLVGIAVSLGSMSAPVRFALPPPVASPRPVLLLGNRV